MKTVSKTDLRTTDTKEKIIKEAEKLYQAGGYSHMGLDQIAKSLNITRAALYHHFPGGKEQLMAEMIRFYSDEMVSRWEADFKTASDARSRFKAMLRSITFKPVFDNKRMICAEMEQWSPATKMLVFESLKYSQNLVKKVFIDGIESGELREIDFNLAFISFMGLCEQIQTFQVMRDKVTEVLPYDGTVDTFIDDLLSLWLNGMAKK